MLIESARHGPAGSLPLEPSDLLDRPSGDLFGWSLNVGMGWQPDALRRPEVLILSTQGGIREPDGTPLALGYHTGHWEVGPADARRAPKRRAALGGCRLPVTSPTRATAARRAPPA